MKEYILLFLLCIPIFVKNMETTVKYLPSHQNNLTAEQAMNAQHQLASSLEAQAAKNITPVLDTYKCAFILGILKQSGIDKLRNKLPREQMGALCAQKKAIGKLLNLQEELDLWYWQTYLNEKYKSQPPAP